MELDKHILSHSIAHLRFFLSFSFYISKNLQINQQKLYTCTSNSGLLYLIYNQALKLFFLLSPVFVSAFLFQHCWISLCMSRRAGLLLCEDEKPAISPSLRVRINPLKTSQILARCSATLGLTTGGNYTFCFLCSHQTAHRPGREHTHARHKIFHVIIAVFQSLRPSDSQQLWEENVIYQTDGKCTGWSYSTTTSEDVQ